MRQNQSLPTRAAALVVTILLLECGAAAQDVSPLTGDTGAEGAEPSDPREEDVDAEAPADTTGASSPECALHDRYDRAFDHFADAEYAPAERLLVEVLASCPDYRGATDLLRHVRERASRLASALPPPPPPEAPPAYESPPSVQEGEDVSGLARAELIISEGLMGLFHGIWICGWSDIGCDAQGGTALAFGGAALFAGTAAALTFDGVTLGQATSIETGTFFGSWLGGAIWAAAGAPQETLMSDEHLIPLFTLVLGGLAGTGAGVAIALTSKPESGQVALASSGGVWGGVVGAMLSLLSATPGYPVEAFGVSQLVGVPVGLLAGALVSTVYRTSRGRMLLVDLGAVLGGALGVAGSLLTSEADCCDYPVHLGAWTSVMIPVGFALTMWITAGLDVPDEVADRVALSPVGPAGLPGVNLNVRF